MTRPTAAARNTITAGAAPLGTAKPRVNSDDPASMKADTRPRAANGHSSKANPTYATTSQVASWVEQDRRRLGGQQPVAPHVSRSALFVAVPWASASRPRPL